MVAQPMTATDGAPAIASAIARYQDGIVLGVLNKGHFDLSVAVGVLARIVTGESGARPLLGVRRPSASATISETAESARSVPAR